MKIGIDKAMKRVLMLATVLTISLLSIIAAGQPKNRAEAAVNKVTQLFEVKTFLSNTPKRYLPTVQLESEPTKNNNYYIISVGINNAEQFRSSLRFYVNALTMQIYYCDWLSANQELMTVKQWRYWRTRPEWNHPHIFKNGKIIITHD